MIGGQRSDDFIFAHLYDGAVKGFIALFEVLHAIYAQALHLLFVFIKKKIKKKKKKI